MAYCRKLKASFALAGLAAITLVGFFQASPLAEAGESRRVVVRQSNSSRNCYTYRQQNFVQHHQQQLNNNYHAQYAQYGDYLVGESLRINAIAAKILDSVEKQAELRRRRRPPTNNPPPDEDSPAPADPLPPDNPPDDNHGGVEVSPALQELVNNSCISCHSGGDAKKGFSLDNLNQLSSLERQAIFGSVVSGYMPYKQAPLSDDEVKLFDDFSKQGTK